MSHSSLAPICRMLVRVFNPVSKHGPSVTVMTRKDFYRKFSAEDWERLCSNDEFLDVFAEEPFDAEKAEAVAKKILDFDSH